MKRTEQKLQTRQRILVAAGRGFRKGGFGGIGVDGLAKEAGVTSGAFYKHFDSKATAFREAVVEGMADLKTGVRFFQTEHGDAWWPAFVRFYLSDKLNCDLAESCALQSLPPEVARADATSRAAFEAELVEVAKLVANGPASNNAPTTTDEAWTALATLVGTVTLARAVDNPTIAKRISAAAEKLLLPNQQAKTKTSNTPARRK